MLWVLLVILLLAPLQIYLWARSSLPKTSGNIALAPLTSDVEIVRDNYGVPHIFAPDWRNAYVALGYLHAQDRFWQMEMMRRAGAGRLSEILGPSTVKVDKLMRVLGLYTNASESYYALGQDVQAALQAYAAGVNGFIEQDDMPLEIRLLGFEPEPWAPADSLVWLKLMAYQLGGSWRDEIDAARLARHIDMAQVGHLLGWNENPNNGQLFGRSDRWKKTEAIDWGTLVASLPIHGPRSASNGWVISPQLSADGNALLANDPHLNLGMPSIWYLARIITPEGSLAGATAPGMPFHVLGQNDRLAWGITSTGADTADLYIEPVLSPEQYRSPFGVENFVSRTETIDVKGAKRIMLTIRQTRHGVVLDDMNSDIEPIRKDGHVIALAATFLRGDDTTAEALYYLNRAHTPSDIEMAARYAQAPVQNLFFADMHGNIGMRVIGSIPRRKGTGALPSNGEVADHDWHGVVPRMNLPRIINPPKGYIGNANEPVITSDYPYLVTSLWLEPYRGERLQQLLATAKQDSVSLDVMASWQNDVYSLPALRLRDHIVAAEPELQSNAEKLAFSVLKSWNGAYEKSSRAPVILTYFQKALLRALLHDELGDDLDALRPVKIGLLLRALEDTKTNWCDNTHTENKETCGQIIAEAWHAAIDRLEKEHGINWEWQQVNTAPLTNRFWSQIPFIASMVDSSTPIDGGPTTLKRADNYSTDPADFLKVDHGAGYRGLFSAGNPDDGRYIISGGQSAHILSKDYANQTPLWAKGQSIHLKGSLAELQKAYGHYLTLQASKNKH